jgi:hypothetical protein
MGSGASNSWYNSNDAATNNNSNNLFNSSLSLKCLWKKLRPEISTYQKKNNNGDKNIKLMAVK